MRRSRSISLSFARERRAKAWKAVSVGSIVGLLKLSKDKVPFVMVDQLSRQFRVVDGNAIFFPFPPDPCCKLILRQFKWISKALVGMVAALIYQNLYTFFRKQHLRKGPDARAPILKHLISRRCEVRPIVIRTHDYDGARSATDDVG